MHNKENEKPISNFDKDNRISEILVAFKDFDGIYKKDQVDAAIELKKETKFYSPSEDFNLNTLPTNFEQATDKFKKKKNKIRKKETKAGKIGQKKKPSLSGNWSSHE
jgi:hypothetical protein